MASNGIRDRVAIVGMGCTTFGERWDKSVSDLLVDSSQDALNSANVPIDAVDAFWLGTLFSGQSGLTLSRPLKLDYKPVSRLENYCATGSEAFRNACYAVACGAYDIAMAIGVEKLKDSGISGLPSIGTLAELSASCDESTRRSLTLLSHRSPKAVQPMPTIATRSRIPLLAMVTPPLELDYAPRKGRVPHLINNGGVSARLHWRAPEEDDLSGQLPAGSLSSWTAMVRPLTGSLRIP